MLKGIKLLVANAKKKEKQIMKEMLIIIAIVGVYLLMQTVILPKMGIST